jgi:hypothetical protein
MPKLSKRQRTAIRQIAMKKGVSYSVAKFIYACMPQHKKDQIAPREVVK